MSPTGIFSLNSGHIRLTDNLIACGNEAWIDRIAITHPEIALPKRDRIPEGTEGNSTVISDYPSENPRHKVINRSPNPDLVLLLAHKGFEYTLVPPLGGTDEWS